MPLSCLLRTLPRCALPAALLCLLAAVPDAWAQETTLMVDPKYSLAWWQVSPHLNHLWATTCPEEPSWRPGEGRSSGWFINPALRPRSLMGYKNIADTINVPNYPRPRIREDVECTEAVKGTVVVADMARWRGVRGKVSVRGEVLVTGENMRDRYARQAVLQTSRYPYIEYAIDSLVNVTHQADTTRGTAVGVLSFRGVDKPMRAVFQAWPEVGGLRVQAKLRFPVPWLLDEFMVSRLALGLGAVTRIWQDMFLGIDMVVRSKG